MQQVSADLSKLSTQQSLSRYNLDSRLENVINTGKGLESIYGQKLIRELRLQNVRSIYKSSIGVDGTEINKGNIYVVAEREVYKIPSKEEYSIIKCRGGLQSNGGELSFAESQSQNIDTEGRIYLYLCDGMALYRINLLAANPEIEDISQGVPIVNGTTSTRGIPSFISFRGHRILLTCSNSTQFFYSETDPDSRPIGKMFPVDNFYSTETKADRTLRVVGMDVIYAFGTKTIEVWRDNNDSFDPYTTSINGNYLTGLSFPHAVCILRNEVYFFDDHRRLCRLVSGRLDVLSDRSTERIWDGKEFAKAFVIYTNGCLIACFQDGEGFTLGYNTQSGSISVLSCLSKVRGGMEEYICDINGNLSEFDDSKYTMADNSVISKIIQLEVLHDLNRFLLRSIAIDYSIKTVPDNDAINNQAFLSVSPDGLNWRDPRILNLDRHSKTLKSFGFGLCSKMHTRLIFTNANPVVFNSVTFSIEGAMK